MKLARAAYLAVSTGQVALSLPKHTQMKWLHVGLAHTDTLVAGGLDLVINQS